MSNRDENFIKRWFQKENTLSRDLPSPICTTLVDLTSDFTPPTASSFPSFDMTSISTPPATVSSSSQSPFLDFEVYVQNPTSQPMPSSTDSPFLFQDCSPTVNLISTSSGARGLQNPHHCQPHPTRQPEYQYRPKNESRPGAKSKSMKPLLTAEPQRFHRESSSPKSFSSSAFPISMFYSSPKPKTLTSASIQNMTMPHDPYQIRFPLTFSPTTKSQHQNHHSPNFNSSTDPYKIRYPHPDFMFKQDSNSASSSSSCLDAQSCTGFSSSFDYEIDTSAFGSSFSGLSSSDLTQQPDLSLLHSFPPQTPNPGIYVRSQHILDTKPMPLAYTASLSELTAFAINLRNDAAATPEREAGATILTNPNASNRDEGNDADVTDRDNVTDVCFVSEDLAACEDGVERDTTTTEEKKRVEEAADTDIQTEGDLDHSTLHVPTKLPHADDFSTELERPKLSLDMEAEHEKAPDKTESTYLPETPRRVLRSAGK